MVVNDLILNACVKTTEMFICEKILTTSGKLLPNHTLTVTHFKCCINISLSNYIRSPFFKQLSIS
jgi:hypothetical protein